jgi:death-on-curing family protein
VSDFSETLGKDLGYLYLRAVEDVGSFEGALSSSDLSTKEVLRAHFAIASHFAKLGEGIGGFGPKDVNLLISAVSRQNAGFGGYQKWNTIHEKAATLMFGLTMNHPFYDANKRTAYLSTVHYLYQNGFMIEVSEKELEDLTVLVAEKGLSKYPRYRDLKKKDADPEVKFLAHYLKKNTRKIDRTQYLITYRELEKILKRYNAWFENPNNNQIDVMHWVEVIKPRTSIFGRAKKANEIRRACKLGFPGWNKQVGQGRLKHVRLSLNLMPEHGIDSQAFFKDVDDMSVLIEMYEGALSRLADR